VNAPAPPAPHLCVITPRLGRRSRYRPLPRDGHCRGAVTPYGHCRGTAAAEALSLPRRRHRRGAVTAKVLDGHRSELVHLRKASAGPPRPIYPLPLPHLCSLACGCGCRADSLTPPAPHLCALASCRRGHRRGGGRRPHKAVAASVGPPLPTPTLPPPTQDLCSLASCRRGHRRGAGRRPHKAVAASVGPPLPTPTLPPPTHDLWPRWRLPRRAETTPNNLSSPAERPVARPQDSHACASLASPSL